TGEHDVLYSMSLPRSGISASGATIHPRRQPVISHALEKLFVLTIRASLAAKSRKDGAHAASSGKYSRSYTSSATIQMPCRSQCSKIARCAARSIVQPVGLLGELII